MGCSGSVPADVPSPDLEKSNSIDKNNLADYRTEKKKIKVLLLGAGESGKTTIRKQMNMVYGKGACPAVPAAARRAIFPDLN